MSRYLGFIGIAALGPLLFTATVPVGEARGETIFAPVGGFELGKIDTDDSSAGSLVGPFSLPQPGEGDPGLLTLAISGAFSTNGTLYTIVNTLAPTREGVSSQLGIIEKNGMITPVGDSHPEFNMVAMEIDSEDNILATGFHLPDNQTFPGFNWFGDRNLYNVNGQTGAFTLIGDTNISDGPIMDMAFNSTGTLYATTANKLWTLDTGSGTSSPPIEIDGVTDGRPEGAEIMAIFFDSKDMLHGIDIVTGDLFIIDTNTGDAEFLKSTGYAAPFSPHGGDIFYPVAPTGIPLNPGLDNPGLGGQLPPGLRDGLPSNSHHAVPEPASVVLLLVGCSICVSLRRRRRPT